MRSLLAARRLFLVLALTWMVVIFWASHRRWDGTIHGPRWLGDLIHAPHFGLLAGLWFLALRGGERTPPVGVGTKAVVAATLWGVVDEIHQGFVPGRDASPADVVTDFGGALLAVLWLRPVFRLDPIDGPLLRRSAVLIALLAISVFGQHAI